MTTYSANQTEDKFVTSLWQAYSREVAQMPCKGIMEIHSKYKQYNNY